MNCGTFRDELSYFLADAIIAAQIRQKFLGYVASGYYYWVARCIIKNTYMLRCHSTLASAGMLACITTALFHRLYYPLPPLRPVQPSTLPLYTYTPSIAVVRLSDQQPRIEISDKD